MKVEIYSDLVCPWCYIGERRFSEALRQFDDEAKVEVAFRPFQLDPDAGTRPIPLRSYLERRYGARSSAMMEQAGAAAAAEGIDMRWDDALAANTFHAHRLLHLALMEDGEETQRALAASLFAAHFTDGADLGDPEVLAARGEGVGMKRERVRAFLASDEGVEETRAEVDRARRIGVRSVPTFVFEGKWGVTGAQSTEYFLETLREVADRGEG